MLNHYHQPCCGERASATEPLRQIQYALQTSRQRALPHSLECDRMDSCRYFIGVLMTKLACHVCIQYIPQLYIYVYINIHIIIRIYIYDAIQRWLWNHPRLVDAWGFQRTSQHLRCRGKQIWPWGVLVERNGDFMATHGLNWMVEACWTNRNSGYPMDISRYSYIS